MNLNQRLMDDLKEALRQHDEPRKAAIRMVRASIKNAEIAMQREATDAEIQGIISREIKKRAEAEELFRRGGRQDLVTAEELEIELLKQYLPQQMSPAEVAEAVQEIIDQLGAAGPEQLGPVMKRAMEQLKGKADGRLVNQVARELLSN